MATFNPPAGVSNYTDLVGIVDGDSIDLNSTSDFTVDVSTILIDDLFSNGTFRILRVLNTSTATPIFLRFQNDTSYWNTQGGTVDIQGAQISLGTADGITADIEYTLPLDAGGDKYEAVGHLIVDGVRWMQATNLTAFHSDERGECFIHDYVNNKVIFGNGTNGKIPSGVVSISNIEIQCNGAKIDTNETNITFNDAIITEPDLRTGGVWNTNKSVIYNSTQSFKGSLVTDSRLQDFSYVGNGSGVNVRFSVPRSSSSSTHGDITYLSESTASTEVVGDDAGYADIGTFKCIFVEQKSTNFSRVRLNNNGGTIQNLTIFGGTAIVYEFYRGTNGTIDTLTWSTGFKRTDQVPYRVLYSRTPETVNQTVNNVVRYGTEAWGAVEMEQFILATYGSIHIKNATLPADCLLDELFELGGLSSGTIDNVLFNGTASSGTRDMDVYSPIGWRLSNIKVTNDASFGNQVEFRAYYNFVSIINQTFAIGAKTKSCIIYTNNASTLGQVVLQPFLDTDISGSELTSGLASSVNETVNRFYLTDTTTKVRNETNVIQASGRPTGYTVNGTNSGNFNIEYRMRLASGVYSGSFITMSLANLQSSYDALSLSDSSLWFIEYTVERTTGTGTSSYIQGIYIDVPIDDTFVWTVPPVDTNISVTGLVAGSNVALLDSSGNVLLNNTIAGTSTSINVNTYIYNPAGGYTIKVRKPGYLPLAFSLTDTGTVGLPTSQVLRIDDDGLQVYGRGTGAAVNMTIDYVNHTYDTSDDAKTEDRNDYIQDQSITDAAMATTVGLNFGGRDALMERYGPSAGQVWMVKRASAGDINARWDAQLTRADNALLSPVNEVNGTVYRSVRGVRNGVDTQLVIDAITAQTTELKGAEDKDLTEVFNNSPTIDTTSIANAVDTKITESHGEGPYNRVGGYAGPNVLQIKDSMKEFVDELEKKYDALIEKIDGEDSLDEMQKYLKDIKTSLIEVKNMPREQLAGETLTRVKGIEKYVQETKNKDFAQNKLLAELRLATKEIQAIIEEEEKQHNELKEFITSLI